MPNRVTKPLLNKSEQRLFDAFMSVLNRHDDLLYVDRQQHLEDFLVKEDPRFSKKEDYGFMIRSSVDLLVTSRASSQPLVAIELDGPSHGADRQRQNDQKKERILSQAGVRLYRFSTDELDNEMYWVQFRAEREVGVEALFRALFGESFAENLLKDRSAVLSMAIDLEEIVRTIGHLWFLRGFRGETARIFYISRDQWRREIEQLYVLKSGPLSGIPFPSDLVFRILMDVEASDERKQYPRVIRYIYALMDWSIILVRGLVTVSSKSRADSDALLSQACIDLVKIISGALDYIRGGTKHGQLENEVEFLASFRRLISRYGLSIYPELFATHPA